MWVCLALSWSKGEFLADISGRKKGGKNTNKNTTYMQTTLPSRHTRNKCEVNQYAYIYIYIFSLFIGQETLPDSCIILLMWKIARGFCGLSHAMQRWELFGFTRTWEPLPWPSVSDQYEFLIRRVIFQATFTVCCIKSKLRQLVWETGKEVEKKQREKGTHWTGSGLWSNTSQNHKDDTIVKRHWTLLVIVKDYSCQRLQVYLNICIK